MTLLGTVAFVVGLSGTGLYIERLKQHKNLVFEPVNSTQNASFIRSTTQSSPVTNPQNAALSQEAALLQPVASSMNATQPSSTLVSPTRTTEPGRGAGDGITSGTSASSSAVQASEGACLVDSCTVTTAEDSADGLTSQ